MRGSLFYFGVLSLSLGIKLIESRFSSFLYWEENHIRIFDAMFNNNVRFILAFLFVIYI